MHATWNICTSLQHGCKVTKSDKKLSISTSLQRACVEGVRPVVLASVGPVLNLAFLMNVMENVKPLNWDAVLDAAIPLKVIFPL